MDSLDLPSLNLAVAPLTASEDSHWAIWVTDAPYPGGHVHHDRYLTPELLHLCQSWQALFSLQATPDFVEGTHLNGSSGSLLETLGEGGESYTTRLMQALGIELWRWVFDGPIHFAFAQSQGIAIGQNRPLRIRLDVRHSKLIAMPWEIMQPQMGKSAIGLNSQILFSRTASTVDGLMPLQLNPELKVLLVQGDDRSEPLRLKTEAQLLQGNPSSAGSAPCQVKILVQPSRAELLAALDRHQYNLFVYSGHGMTAPDGGRLHLRSHDFLSGTELAQSLVRNHIPLAVFNACWGAQLDYVQNDQTGHLEAVPHSSLVETLIHHGVPAVVGMRDVISDPEALHFIERLMQALRQQRPVDEAVTIARQHLLGLYGFNQPSWTLPVLYMHPEFQGQLMTRVEVRTELPTGLPALDAFPQAEIRSQNSNGQVWPIEAGLLRVGRREENDLVLAEQWVSQRHAEIICRTMEGARPSYFIKDFSRFGTLLCHKNQWQRIHHQQVPLTSGTLLRFGSAQGELLQFVVLGE